MTAPWVSGLGGGGVALVRSPNGSYEFIDYRENAPAAAFEDMFNDDVDASTSGGLARYGNPRCSGAEKKNG